MSWRGGQWPGPAQEECAAMMWAAFRFGRPPAVQIFNVFHSKFHRNFTRGSRHGRLAMGVCSLSLSLNISTCSFFWLGWGGCGHKGTYPHQQMVERQDFQVEKCRGIWVVRRRCGCESEHAGGIISQIFLRPQGKGAQLVRSGPSLARAW